jgi:hypothetical protein
VTSGRLLAHRLEDTRRLVLVLVRVRLGLRTVAACSINVNSSTAQEYRQTSRTGTDSPQISKPLAMAQAGAQAMVLSRARGVSSLADTLSLIDASEKLFLFMIYAFL